MWTIHRVESSGGDLIVYARCLDNKEFPQWATGEALAKAAVMVPCSTRGRGTVRALTEEEEARECREVAKCQATLNTVCASVDRRVDAVAAEMQLCNKSIAYAAIDFPGAGWCGDSAACVYIPVGR